MALRDVGGARLRRAARSRVGVVVLLCALYLAAGALATWPALGHANSRFLAGGANGHGEAAAGDHLQTGYRLWLVGHQLEHGRAPWRDPYQFQPEVEPQLNLAAWPFGLPYWPLVRALGPVRAWNAFLLLTYAAAGLLAFAWLRELELGASAAAAGGLAFAIAPYRVAQSVGHLLGPISILLPLALLCLERGRPGRPRRFLWIAGAGAAVASIPLSGQVHLALGAVPFFVGYAVCRFRDLLGLAAVAAAAAAAVGAGLFVRYAVIAGSLDEGGRSLAEVDLYSADWQDLVARHRRHGNEAFVFLGWGLPVAALAGLVLLVRARRFALAAALGLGGLLPILLALGTNLALYRWLYHALPPLRYPRVPERTMPIACLALAGLAAFAIASAARRARHAAVPAVALALLLVDLRVTLYGASVADEGNAAYAAVARGAPGRLLELPVFLPDRHFGSVYQYYSMQGRRERPSGYSTVAPLDADAVLRRLLPLNCGDWSRGASRLLDGLGVRYVAVHEGLYTRNPLVRGPCVGPAERGLRAHGFRRVARDGAVTVFARS